MKIKINTNEEIELTEQEFMIYEQGKEDGAAERWPGWVVFALLMAASILGVIVGRFA